MRIITPTLMSLAVVLGSDEVSAESHACRPINRYFGLGWGSGYHLHSPPTSSLPPMDYGHAPMRPVVPGSELHAHPHVAQPIVPTRRIWLPGPAPHALPHQIVPANGFMLPPG